MSVSIAYKGRIGNNMFQYAMARLIAAHNGLKLVTPWNDPKFIEATDNPEGLSITGDLKRVVDTLENPLREEYCCEVVVDGFFQDARYYNEWREEIRTFWKLPTTQKNTEDLVIHLRLTDYYWRPNSCVIHPEWYYSIIKREKFRKLYIVVEPHVTNKKYLSYFKQYRPVIVSGTPKDDFEFLMSFDRIACSNSTFAWWAAFLGNASKIWLHKKWMGLHRVNSRLVNMAGAIIKDGEFFRNKYLEALDWRDYWKQPDDYFRTGN